MFVSLVLMVFEQLPVQEISLVVEGFGSADLIEEEEVETGGQDVAVLDDQVGTLEAVLDPEDGIFLRTGVTDQSYRRRRDYSTPGKKGTPKIFIQRTLHPVIPIYQMNTQEHIFF